jgi:hypothetical protein
MDPTLGNDDSVQLGRIPNRQTFQLGFNISDDAGPVDLTGSTARMEFRTSVDVEPALVLTSEGGGISFVALSGQVEVVADEDLVSGLCGYYVWGFAVRDGSGGVPWIVTGDVEFFRPPVEVPIE